jgi:hypothetical protein
MPYFLDTETNKALKRLKKYFINEMNNHSNKNAIEGCKMIYHFLFISWYDNIGINKKVLNNYSIKNLFIALDIITQLGNILSEHNKKDIEKDTNQDSLFLMISIVSTIHRYISDIIKLKKLFGTEIIHNEPYIQCLYWIELKNRIIVWKKAMNTLKDCILIDEHLKNQIRSVDITLKYDEYLLKTVYNLDPELFL